MAQYARARSWSDQVVISKHVTGKKRRSMSAASHQLNRIFMHILTPLVLPAAVAMCATTMTLASAPLPGAIFTTDPTCTGVNVNIYGSKDAVCLDGGPAHPGAAGLPDGC